MYQGYKVLIATFLCRFVALGALYSSGLFLVYLEETFDVPGSIASFFPSIYGSLALLSALIAGYVQDKLINRDIPISFLFVFGGMMLGGGMIGSSYSNDIVQVLLFACFTGTGIGIVGFSTSGILAQWFVKWRSTALLIGMSGNGAGSFAFTIALQAMFEYFQATNNQAGEEEQEESEEWRQALRICGAMSFLTVLCSASFIRVPFPGEVEEYEITMAAMTEARKTAKEKLALSKKNGSTTPRCTVSSVSDTQGITSSATVDVLMDEESCVVEVIISNENLKEKSTLSSSSSDTPNDLNESNIVSAYCSVIDNEKEEHQIQNIPQSNSSPRRSGGVSVPGRGSLRRRESYRLIQRASLTVQQTIWTKTFLILLIWEVCNSLTFNNFFAHVQAFAVSNGLSSSVGAFALSLTGIGMLCGGFTLGYVSDKIGPTRALQVAVFSLMFTVVAWPLCITAPTLWTVSFFYGYFAVGLPSIPLAILTSTFGKVSHLTILTCIGIIHGIQAPGKLFGPVIMGVLFDQSGEYDKGFFFTFGVMFIGNMSLLFLPRTEWQLRVISEKYPELSYDS